MTTQHRRYVASALAIALAILAQLACNKNDESSRDAGRVCPISACLDQNGGVKHCNCCFRYSAIMVKACSLTDGKCYVFADDCLPDGYRSCYIAGSTGPLASACSQDARAGTDISGVRDKTNFDLTCKAQDAYESYLCSTALPCTTSDNCPTDAPVKCGGTWICYQAKCTFKCP